MKRFWMAFAAVLAVVALVFAFRRDFDKAFISATLGAVAWFLSYRVQVREMITAVDGAANEDETNEQNPDDE